LIDQFLQDVSNDRTDDYGGSLEKRCKFALEVTKAVAEAVGEERTGMRIGVWVPYQGLFCTPMYNIKWDNLNRHGNDGSRPDIHLSRFEVEGVVSLVCIPPCY